MIGHPATIAGATLNAIDRVTTSAEDLVGSEAFDENDVESVKHLGELLVLTEAI